LPPVHGFLQPVVFGNEIGNFRIDLTARNAKAWDSIKSPLILYSSISLKFTFEGNFSLIFLIKILFFLPPPHNNIFWIFSFEFFNDIDNSSPIILAVKSVKVVTRSQKLSL